jgi:hypothetical protein
VPLAEGVTLEVLVEPGPWERPADADDDEEILDTCCELWDFSGQPQVPSDAVSQFATGFADPS